MRPFYGVDQSDRVRLTEIVDAEFDGELLDLVLDDASHEYLPTRTSFEVLFPRLRPGGVFVIEDWTTDHTNTKRVVAAMQDRSAPNFAERERQLTQALVERHEGREFTPVHRLGVELMQMCADSSDLVSEITIDLHWIAVRRGPAELDTATFRLDDHHSGAWSWTSP